MIQNSNIIDKPETCNDILEVFNTPIYFISYTSIINNDTVVQTFSIVTKKLDIIVSKVVCNNIMSSTINSLLFQLLFLNIDNNLFQTLYDSNELLLVYYSKNKHVVYNDIFLDRVNKLN